MTYRPRLLLAGDKGQGQSTHIGPAVLHSMESLPVYTLDLPALYAISVKTPEESCAQVGSPDLIFSMVLCVVSKGVWIVSFELFRKSIETLAGIIRCILFSTIESYKTSFVPINIMYETIHYGKKVIQLGKIIVLTSVPAV